MERPELGRKYAALDNGLWYRLHEDDRLGEMSAREYSEFVDWRVESLMSRNPSSSKAIVETAQHDVEASASDNSEYVDFNTYKYEDNEEGEDKWLLDTLLDEDLGMFTMDDLEETHSSKTNHHNHVNNHTENHRSDSVRPTEQSPRRRSRKQKTRNWKSHSLIDESGHLDLVKRKGQEGGKRLRHRCNWLRVPALPAPASSSVPGVSDVPDVVMTSPGGGSYTLHDPLDYEWAAGSSGTDEDQGLGQSSRLE